MNKVFIVGAGPGDFDLLTLKAKEVIKSADCIIYDRLINPRILNFAKEDAELIYLGKSNTEGGTLQEKINNTIVQKSLDGKVVVRLKGGDPFVFGRGGEEIFALNKNNISFEVIPGITSSISVPAYAGIPVTHRALSRSFHVFTGQTMDDTFWHDFSVIAKLEGTLIFLMSIKKLEKIVEDLKANGKPIDTPIAIIEKGATSKQRVITGTLDNIVAIAREENIVPPSIIVIGEVVNLRDEFKWFEDKPLFGKRILVTRDRAQSDIVCNKIESLGGTALELPFIEIEFLKNNILSEKIKNSKVILFNSANGVRAFLEEIKDLRTLSHLKIGAIGKKTRELLMENKLIPDFTPSKYLMEELVKESHDFSKDGDNILVVTSDISPFDSEKFSNLYNRNFEILEMYKTKKNLQDKELVFKTLEKIDIITFLSSSAVESFFESINGEVSKTKHVKFASIGPVTSETLRSYGFTVDYEATKYDAFGVIDSIMEVR